MKSSKNFAANLFQINFPPSLWLLLNKVPTTQKNTSELKPNPSSSTDLNELQADTVKLKVINQLELTIAVDVAKVGF